MLAEFLFTNDKTLDLEETSRGTRVVHREVFRGLLVPLFWKHFEGAVPSMLKAMNEALKARVEKS